MEANIIAFTHEGKELDMEQIKTLCGKNAGICYMKGTEFNGKVTDTEKAIERFNRTIRNAHHSIADHMKVEIYFKDISKMLAIILNSLQDYATSEKSGRYTEMITDDPDEKRLYNKWKTILARKIAKVHPEIPAEMTEKLAQENARYMLSVFTRSTSMGYSTSIRQWNYIIDWCEKYLKYLDNQYITGHKISEFEARLRTDIVQLHAFLVENLYIENLRDTKNRCFEFLGVMSGNPEHPVKYCDYDRDIVLNTVYQVTYKASFVQIAQAQRHRTIKYFALSDLSETPTHFFLPPILKTNTKLKTLWIKDLESIADHYPQASMIRILETGHISDFILKCEERLCGRAQWEIMDRTRITAEAMLKSAELSDSRMFKAYAEKLRGTHNGLKTKRELCSMCMEPCVWTCEHAFDRNL